MHTFAERDDGLCAECGLAEPAAVHGDDIPELPVDADPHHHHRTDAPATSVAAAYAVDITAQARQVLGAYASGERLTDHQAYARAGLTVDINGARARCSDLRHAHLIEVVGEGRAPSGRRARLCALTELGREYLAREDLPAVSAEAIAAAATPAPPTETIHERDLR